MPLPGDNHSYGIFSSGIVLMNMSLLSKLLYDITKLHGTLFLGQVTRSINFYLHQDVLISIIRYETSSSSRQE